MVSFQTTAESYLRKQGQAMVHLVRVTPTRGRVSKFCLVLACDRIFCSGGCYRKVKNLDIVFLTGEQLIKPGRRSLNDGLLTSTILAYSYKQTECVFSSCQTPPPESI